MIKETFELLRRRKLLYELLSFDPRGKIPDLRICTRRGIGSGNNNGHQLENNAIEIDLYVLRENDGRIFFVNFVSRKRELIISNHLKYIHCEHFAVNDSIKIHFQYIVQIIILSTLMNSNIRLYAKNPFLKINIEDNKKIIFHRGEYRIKNTIIIKNINNIIIDGNGSSIIMNNPLSSFLRISDSNSVTIKNLRIDYDPPPSVGVLIKRINRKKKTIVVKVFSHYCDAMKKNLTFNIKNREIYIYPLKRPGVVTEGGTPVSFIDKIQSDDNVTYMLKMKNIKYNLHKNSTSVIVFRKNGSPVFFMRDDHNIKFQDITIFSSPASAFTALNVSGLKIKSCNILLKTGRWLSTNADGVHCQSCRYGPEITHSIFEGLGDDIVSLYTNPMFLSSVGEKSITVTPKWYTKLLSRGDVIEYFNPTSGEIMCSATLKSVDNKHAKLFFEKLPRCSKNIQHSYIYDTNLTSHHFTIQNNIFKQSRRYGLYLKAYHGKITSNKFIDLGGSAIVLSNEVGHYKGGLNSEDIVIEKNFISNSGHGFHNNQPLINISFRKEGGLSRMSPQRNIRLLHNYLYTDHIKYMISNVSNFFLNE